MRINNKRLTPGVAHLSPAVTAFTPSQLSGLVMWLRADMGITLNGSNVSAWADQSGNGLSVSQGTGGSQPAYTASLASYNGRPVVQTSGGTYLFRATTPNTPQPATVIWIGKSTTNGNIAIGLSASTVPAIEPALNALNVNAGSLLTAPISIASPCAVYVEFNGASSRACVNNWQTGGTTGNAGTNAFAGLGIGAYEGGTFPSPTDCAELIIYNRILAAAEQKRIATYIATRYGFVIT